MCVVAYYCGAGSTLKFSLCPILFVFSTATRLALCYAQTSSNKCRYRVVTQLLLIFPLEKNPVLGITPERVESKVQPALAHGAAVEVSSPELRDHGREAVIRQKGNTVITCDHTTQSVVSVGREKAAFKCHTSIGKWYRCPICWYSPIPIPPF